MVEATKVLGEKWLDATVIVRLDVLPKLIWYGVVILADFSE